ncbi:unnamed protein product [Symbiodinium natans]|uniref:Uncharacterized protein n=1 Tax=Symbiodinium natans TaxID=878477 RepID=A0A812SI10_9DINO|nr:unnamed protein product [Symbiodinium natans]
MLVKALSACPGSLLEFETDAAIGGQDPFGFLADSLPQLRMLRARYMFGKTGNLAGLKRLVHLKKKQCKLPKENHRLSGRPAVDTQRGIVYWGITSEHHDDNYSGEGLWWDELENTCECMEEWGVGKGVTKEHCLEFMEECGIELDHHLNDEDCGMDSSLANDVDSDQDTIVVQLEVENSDNSTAVIRARTMDGRQFAQVTVDTGKMLTRFPCSPLALRLVLHNGTCIDVLEKGTQPLAAVLA